MHTIITHVTYFHNNIILQCSMTMVYAVLLVSCFGKWLVSYKLFYSNVFADLVHALFFILRNMLDLHLLFPDKRVTLLKLLHLCCLIINFTSSTFYLFILIWFNAVNVYSTTIQILL